MTKKVFSKKTLCYTLCMIIGLSIQAWADKQQLSYALQRSTELCKKRGVQAVSCPNLQKLKDKSAL